MSTIILNKPLVKNNLGDLLKEQFVPRYTGNDASRDNKYLYYADKPEKDFYFSNSTYINHTKNLVAGTDNRHLGYFPDAQYNVPKSRRPSYVLVVTETYLDVLDKINEAMYNGVFDIDLDDRVKEYFLSGLVDSNKLYRFDAIQYAYRKGVITEAELNACALNNISSVEYDPLESTWRYEPINDYYIFNYNKPLKLEERWVNSVNNPNNEQLYLLFPTYGKAWRGFNATGGTSSSSAVTYFYKNSTDTTIAQLSYMAFTLGDLLTDSEIQMDHVDRIDYFDSLEFAIKLPKTI